MGKIEGITVALIERAQTSSDAYNQPVFSETYTYVDNVLVAPVSGNEAVETYNLEGKRAVYQLAIPKGDTNHWENQIVEFFGKRWKVIGPATQGIDSLIPLSWNKKVTVELYE